MPCNYYSSNGKPSRLFADLYQQAREFTPNEEDAEVAALTVYLNMHTDSYKQAHGDWSSPNYQGRVYEDTREPILAEDTRWKLMVDAVWDFAPEKRDAFVKRVVDKSTPSAFSAEGSVKQMMDALQKSFGIPYRLAAPEERAGGQSFGRLLEDGTVVVDPTHAKTQSGEIPFHEYGHALIHVVYKQNRAAYNRLLLEASAVPGIEAYVNDTYPDLDPTSRNHEVIAHVLGQYSAKAKEIAQKRGLVAAIKEFLQELAAIVNRLIKPDYKITLADIERGMTLRELAFHMGTGATFDIGGQTAVVAAIAANGIKNGKVNYTATSRAQVEYLKHALGSHNVEVVEEPAEGKTEWKLRVTNPVNPRAVNDYVEAKAAEEKEKEEQIYEKTGNAFIDATIAKLVERTNSLKLQVKSIPSKTQRNRTEAERRRVQSLIASIYETNSLTVIFDAANVMTDRFNRELQMNLSLEELQSRLKLLRSWGDMDHYITEENSNYDVQKAAEAIISKANKTYAAYYKKFLETFKKEMGAKGVAQSWIDDMLRPYEDIGGIGKNFFGSGFSSNKLEIATDYLIKMKHSQHIEENMQFKRELSKVRASIGDNWAFMLTRKDGKAVPVSKYNQEIATKLYDTRNQVIEADKASRTLRKQIRELEEQYHKAMLAGDIDTQLDTQVSLQPLYAKLQALKQSASWTVFYKQLGEYFDFVPVENQDEEWRQFQEDLMEDFYKPDETGQIIFDQKGYDKVVEMYDPAQFLSMLAGTGGTHAAGARFFDIKPKADRLSELYSPEYRAMGGSQKEAFEWFHDKFQQASGRIFTYSFDQEFGVDSMIREFLSTDKPVLDKMKGFGPVKEFFESLYTIQTKEDKEADVYGVFSGLNRKLVTFRSRNSFVDHKKPLDKQDIGSILEKFHSAGLMYQMKKDVEDVLLASKELSYHLDHYDTQYGKIKKDLFGDDKTTKARSNVSERLEHTVNMFLYDDYKDKVTGAVREDGKQASLEKLVDNMNDFTRLRQMGLNPISALSNLVVGTLNNWMMAADGRFYTDEDMRWAYYTLKGSVLKTVTLGGVKTSDAQKVAALLLKFRVLGDQHDSQMISGKVAEIMFKMQQVGEYMNQASVMLAMLHNTKVTGRNGQEYTLWDALTVNDGVVEVNDVLFDKNDVAFSQQRLFEVGLAMQDVVKRVHGDYDSANMMMFKRSAVGRALMTFRTWLPQALLNRFGKMQKDEYLSLYKGEDVYMKGRFRSLWETVGGSEDETAVLNKNTLVLLGNLVTGYIPFVKNGLFEYDNLSDLDRRNLNVALREIRLYGLILLASLVLGKIKDDDDEEAKKSWFVFFFNMSQRFENEMSFFFNVQSANKTFLRDFVPLANTIEQFFTVLSRLSQKITDPEADIYQRGFRKDTSKFWKEFQTLFPGTKQYQNVWSFFSQLYDQK